MIKDKDGNTGYAPVIYLHCFSEDTSSSSSSSTTAANATGAATSIADNPLSCYEPLINYCSQQWFHGDLNRSQAYTLLVNERNTNGTFIIRNNSSEKGKYTLCILKE
jgi:hypothetical protein